MDDLEGFSPGGKWSRSCFFMETDVRVRKSSINRDVLAEALQIKDGLPNRLHSVVCCRIAMPGLLSCFFAEFATPQQASAALQGLELTVVHEMWHHLSKSEGFVQLINCEDGLPWFFASSRRKVKGHYATG